MNPNKTNTMTAAKTPALKNPQKSPLRRPGSALAPMHRKPVSASLQSSAWPCRPAGGPEPAANHGPEAESGKTAEKPLAGGPVANGTAPAPAAEFQPNYDAAAADDQARDDTADWLANLAAGLAAMAPEPALTAAELATELDAMAAEAHAEVPDLKPCPFCRRSDRLQILGVSFERHDFSEVYCDMVKCHRCECLVPVGVWQGAAFAPAAGTEVLP
jgi:hypothetical protein